MSLLGSVWFCAWRTGLSGLVLGGVFGAAHGAGVVSFFFAVVSVGFVAVEGTEPTGVLGFFWLWLVFGVIAAVWGGFAGAAWGLILGLLDGLALAALTRALYRPGPTDAQEYRRTAALACAAASAAAFLSNWALRGFPEATPFALGAYGLFPAGVPTNSLPRTDGAGAVATALFVVLPSLWLSLAAFVSARLTAERYARKLDEGRG